MERLWTLSSSGRVKFSDFDLEIPGTDRVERVTSLEQVRRLEREGEARGRPFAVHQYSIDKGQGPERNAFGPPPSQAIPHPHRRGRVSGGRGDHG